MKMNTYIVKVLILTNGYEKTVTKLVYATNEENAGRDALVGECHGDIDDGTAQWDGDCIHDLMDEFIYKVKRVTQVDDSDILTLRKYLN